MDAVANNPLTGVISTVTETRPAAPTRDPEVMEAAKSFESVFVRQMLEHAGFAEAFGGKDNQTVDAFSTFLLDKVADDIVDQGGFGLAEQFYRQLARADVQKTEE